jgi:sugar phosphate isomerase/epimerase
MHEKDPATREKQFDEGRRFIDLAQAMGVKYVRMFGDKIPEGEPKEEVMKRVVEGFQQMAAYAKPAGVTVLIESHGDFTHSADVEDILTRVGSPQFALLWDAHHSFVAGGEKKPADTHAKLGKWVRHTHLKDSKPEGADRRYVLVGSGEVPVKEQVRVLAGAGYGGFYCFEWEKKWHPEIESRIRVPGIAGRWAASGRAVSSIVGGAIRTGRGAWRRATRSAAGSSWRKGASRWARWPRCRPCRGSPPPTRR